MNLLNHEDIETLIAPRQGPCVSLFMPVNREPDQTQANLIRLKNLHKEARGQIKENWPEVDALALLQPAQQLVDNGRFWNERNDGLAIFLAPQFQQIYNLPLNLDTQARVGNQFYIKPLLPLLTSNGRFYILALSQNEIRLLQGSRDTINRVEAPQLPDNLADALQWDDPERQLQWHTSTDADVGVRDAIFHGHSVAAEESHKDDILRYFHHVDKGVRHILADENVPLLLAGVDYLHSLYREANKYPHLLDEGIMGNPEEKLPEELHQEAWAIIEPHFQQAREEAAADYQAVTGNGRASNDLAEIVSAAHYGRIDTLFVATDRERWGHFDPDTAQVTLHDEARPDADELLNLAAIQSLMNSGAVFATPAEEMPVEAPIAAIFRYER